jgi:hypothetical protein
LNINGIFSPADAQNQITDLTRKWSRRGTNGHHKHNYSNNKRGDAHKRENPIFELESDEDDSSDDEEIERTSDRRGTTALFS